MPELRRSHLIDMEVEARLLFGEGAYVTTPAPVLRCPNGSRLFFAHCNTRADIMDSLSSQWGFIGIDEFSTFLPGLVLEIAACARAPIDAPYQAVVRATSNPLGVGAGFMYDWFVDKTVDLEAYPDYRPDDYGMLFSTLAENPHLDRLAYAARLKNLPEHVRRAWLLGERVTEGAYFADFHPSRDREPWHVIDDLPTLKDTDQIAKPFLIYPWVRIYRALDWGYDPDPAVCLWIAVLPNTRAVVFKERTWRHTLAPEVAQQIRRESEGMRIVETFCDPTLDFTTGQSRFSIFDQFEHGGVPLTKSRNDRELAGYAIHQYLNTIIDGTPQLQIVRGMGSYGCPHLIRTLPTLQMEPPPGNPAKIAPGEDHYAIALAYFCMGQAAPSQAPAPPRLGSLWRRPRPRQYPYL